MNDITLRKYKKQKSFTIWSQEAKQNKNPRT